MPTGPSSTFQSGGIVRSDALYVERAADRQVFEALLRSELCYVLAPRQIGKSSLLARAKRRLLEESPDARIATIELNTLGALGLTPENWYFGLLDRLRSALRIQADPLVFWNAHALLSPVQRWTKYLREVVLQQIQGRVLIIIDEIELILSLSFPHDDFFASVRAMHNARADDPEHDRLTFCFIGVSSPSDLMRDATRTPFNIGTAVHLDDFTRDEAKGFLQGLSGAGGNPRALLDEVLSWTDGHPYMTQKLCSAIVDAEDREGSEVERVARVVQEELLWEGRLQDQSLAYAAKQFLKTSTNPHAAEMLKLYGRLLREGTVPAVGDSAVQTSLRLAGMAAHRRDDHGAHLRVRNRVFAHVFDEAWVRDKEAERVLTAPLNAWEASGRKDDLVLRGEALADAQRWADGRDDVAVEERDFLFASLEVARLEEVERVRTAQKLKGQQRLIASIAAAAIVIITLVIYHSRAQHADAQRLQSLTQARDLAEAGYSSTMRSLRDERDGLKNASEADRKEKQAKIDSLEGDLDAGAARIRDLASKADEAARAADLARKEGRTGFQIMEDLLTTTEKDLERARGEAAECKKARAPGTANPKGPP